MKTVVMRKPPRRSPRTRSGQYSNREPLTHGPESVLGLVELVTAVALIVGSSLLPWISIPARVLRNSIVPLGTDGGTLESIAICIAIVFALFASAGLWFGASNLRAVKLLASLALVATSGWYALNFEFGGYQPEVEYVARFPIGPGAIVALLCAIALCLLTSLEWLPQLKKGRGTLKRLMTTQ